MWGFSKTADEYSHKANMLAFYHFERIYSMISLKERQCVGCGVERWLSSKDHILFLSSKGLKFNSQ